MKKVDAIITADLHARPDVPECRTDDYLSAQESKFDFIIELAIKYNAPILTAGDIGHSHQWPNWLLEMFLSKAQQAKFIVIPGQHDLPGHNIANMPASGLGVLGASGLVTILTGGRRIITDTGIAVYGFAYGENLSAAPPPQEWPRVAMIHELVTGQKNLWPGETAARSKALLKKHEYELIVSGDNHESFYDEYEGKMLINPGSMMRMRADQIGHRPRVFLWGYDQAKNLFEEVFFPIEKAVVSRDHVEEVERKRKRKSAYIERLGESKDISLSFEDNMEARLQQHKTEEAVENKVWEAMGR